MTTPPGLTELGRIVRLQIQRAALKIGVKPHERYDPAALLAVETLTLTAHGAEADDPAGGRVLDIHHALHPHSRNADGENALSIGFTAHYAAMQARFGPLVALGCAGENLLVASEQAPSLAALAGGLVIHTQAGGLVRLGSVLVAAPCRPFTRYLLSGTDEDDTLKAGLQFLNGGRRGFYVALAQPEPATIAIGDRVSRLGV